MTDRTQEIWREWWKIDEAIDQLVAKQGELIRERIETTKDKFREVDVKRHLDSDERKFKAIELPRSLLYYAKGCFYAKVKDSSDGIISVTAALGFNELRPVFQDIDFLNCSVYRNRPMPRRCVTPK